MNEIEKYLYDEIDDKSLQIRIDYNIYEKKIDLFKLCDFLNITLIKYGDLSETQLLAINDKYNLNDGLSLIFYSKGKINNYLFYNESKPESRLRFTICHEIYHILNDNVISESLDEILADHFSRNLLIPKCLLIHEKYDDVYKVVKDFGVSYDAANYALDSALKWYNSKRYHITKVEEEFLKMYDELKIKK